LVRHYFGQLSQLTFHCLDQPYISALLVHRKYYNIDKLRPLQKT
jgi:hypothetical protein